VFIAGKLIGYVELGKEIQDVLDSLYVHSGSDLAVVIEKKYLDRKSWEEGMVRLGRPIDWGRFPHVVVAYFTKGRLPDAFGGMADPETKGSYSHGQGEREVTFDGKTWRVSAMPLKDVAGAEVGDLLAMRDVSAEKEAFARLVILAGIAGVVLLALLLAFIYVLLYRTDDGIRVQQAALREANDYLDNLFNYANAPMVVWDPQFKITRFNHAFEILTGRSAAELLGKRVENLFSSDQTEAVAMDLIRKMLTDKRSEASEIRIRHTDGSVRTVLWSCATLFSANGSTPVATIAQGQDITDRKQAEEKIAKQNKFMQAVLDSLSHPFYVIDVKNYEVVLANAKARSLAMGCKISTCHALSHHRDTPCTGEKDICPLNAVKNTKAGVTLEHLHYDSQGNIINAEVHGYPIFDEAGNVAQMIEYSFDITERKRIQKELAETHAQLKESVGQLIQAEKMTALGELTAGVAHELNQPLNVAKIICQGILRDIEKGRFSMDEAKTYLPQIIVQIGRMAEIINHMRIFTRRSDSTNREPCNVNTVVDDVLRFVTQQYKDHNVMLVKNTTPGLPFVFGNQTQIEQVCLNLLNNARHAVENSSKNEKRIEIRTALAADDKIVIEVVDNGYGIPENLKTKIFQQFFTTKEPGQGTGLGLALCRKLIEEHKGTIAFDSVEGEGTTFRVTLPAYKGKPV
jgi:PAS domain S-box-containing protein